MSQLVQSWSVTRTVCEPWQTNTPQHAYRSVPENMKRRLQNCSFSSYVMLFVAHASWLSTTSPQSSLANMIQRTAWDDGKTRTCMSQKTMIVPCPLLLWRVRSSLSSEFEPFLSVKISCIYDCAHNFLILGQKNNLSILCARHFCCLTIHSSFVLIWFLNILL